MSRADYERAIADLEASGAGEPDGRTFHAAYGDDDVHLFEVWDSQEQFEAHRPQLFEVLQGVGVSSADVQMHTVHSEH
ncbi:MAG TPA: hypothetical protein VGF74_12075 [Thermoleophilaceae bacterium]|jgi:hypothetical protein